MNSKLIRTEYYDEDHLLNEQEYKEFNFVRIDPYWKVRAVAYDLTVNCFGFKEALIRRIDTHLYNRYMNKKTNSAQALKIAATDIEIIVKNLKCSTGKFHDVTLKQLEDSAEKDEALNGANKENIIQNNTVTPWKVVPELNTMEKQYSYSDVYRGMAALMRPCMVFYNHFEDNESLTAIVALPYTPKMVNYLSPLHVFNMTKAFGMKVHYDLANITDVLSQKLLDLFYLVEDLPRVHGIVPCQCSVRPCHNIGSTFCANHMCKICCQDTQHRLPCMIHDRYDQFFRYKLKAVYFFEDSMKLDRTRTIRLHCRRHMRKKDLLAAFDGYEINENEIYIYYHYASHRLEYIYISFKNQAQAKEIIEQKHMYTLRLEKYDVRISEMSNSLYSHIEKYGEVPSVGIIKPLSTLEVAEEVPSGEEYIEKLHHLIQMITRLSRNNYELELDINPITGSPDDRHVFIKLPNREAVDVLYRSQPLLGCLVVIKFSHTQFFSFMRYTPDLCMMCSSKKDPKCIHDMCKDCCSRQQFGIADCQCSQDILLEKKNKIISNVEKKCQKCDNPADDNCSNKLCFTCCPIQAIRRDCAAHDESFYCRNLRQLK